MRDEVLPSALGAVPVWATRAPCVLPLAAIIYFPNPTGTGLVHISAPAGTPVHAVSGGRVIDVDADRAGEVVVRLERGTAAHYRRLAPSTISVTRGDVVTAGDVLGFTAPVASDSDGGLLFGLRDDDDRWLDPDRVLLGATDPAQFGVSAFHRDDRSGSGNLVTAVSTARIGRSSEARDQSTLLTRAPTRPERPGIGDRPLVAAAVLEVPASSGVPEVPASPEEGLLPPLPSRRIAAVTSTPVPPVDADNESSPPPAPSRLVSRRPRPGSR